MSAVGEWAGSWRVALRLAVRAARRAPARTTLLAVMLALPVYAGTVLALSYTAIYSSADTEASWTAGSADVIVEGADLRAALATVPAGTRTLIVSSGRAVIAHGDHHVLRNYEAAEVTDPVLRSRYLIRAGRAAQGADEISVSDQVSHELGIGLGDHITAGLPSRQYTVVGVIDNANELSMPLLVVPAAHPLTTDAGHRAYVSLPPQDRSWQPGGDAGFTSRSQPSPVELAARAASLVLVVGFASTQVALLVGSAFAVGAHRRRRELAMIGAVGASRRQLVRLGLADGAVLGVASALVGIAGGLLTVTVARSTIERIANHPLSDRSVPVLWLIGIAVFAVGIGVGAALTPARGAARRSVRSAMSGRETPTPAGSARWLIAAAALIGLGALAAVLAAGPLHSTVVLAAGTIAVLLGVTACAPVLVALLGRFANGLPLAARLALRHAARHRLRTAASVAAVCAAVAGSTALALFVGADTSSGEATRPALRSGQVLLGPNIAARLSPAQIQEVAAKLAQPRVVNFSTVDNRQAAFHSLTTIADGASADAITASTQIAVAGPDLVQAVTGQPASTQVVDVLHRGGAVVFAAELITGETAEILTVDDTSPRVQLPAVLVHADAPYSRLPGMVISAPTAAQHRLPTHPGGVLFEPQRPPTATEIDAATSVALAGYVRTARADTPTPEALTVGVKPVAPGRRYDTMLLVLGVLSAFMTIAGGAIAVALSVAEMRDDLSTLAAVGALPALRRRIAGAQAGLIVGLGVLLGVAAGIAPAAGMVAFRPDLHWNVPWLPLMVAVIIGPLIAVVATTALTRPQLVLIRRIQ